MALANRCCLYPWEEEYKADSSHLGWMILTSQLSYTGVEFQGKKMSQLDREQARYEQGYAAGSRSSNNNSATGIIVGVFAVAVLGVGAWFVFAQTSQKSTGDTDVINVPAPEAPEAPKPPEVNINVPKPEINLPKPDIDVPNPEDGTSESSSSSESGS